MFITTRRAREAMISVLQDLKQPIDSHVLKVFETYADADKYKREIEEVNNKLNKLL